MKVNKQSPIRTTLVNKTFTRRNIKKVNIIDPVYRDSVNHTDSEVAWLLIDPVYRDSVNHTDSGVAWLLIDPVHEI